MHTVQNTTYIDTMIAWAMATNEISEKPKIPMVIQYEEGDLRWEVVASVRILNDKEMEIFDSKFFYNKEHPFVNTYATRWTHEYNSVLQDTNNYILWIRSN